MSEGAGVRVRRQQERLHPGNHLKNLNNTFTKALVVVDKEPESAESQEMREYSNLDGLDGLYSGEIFLRTSYTQRNNGLDVCINLGDMLCSTHGSKSCFILSKYACNSFTIVRPAMR